MLATDPIEPSTPVHSCGRLARNECAQRFAFELRPTQTHDVPASLSEPFANEPISSEPVPGVERGAVDVDGRLAPLHDEIGDGPGLADNG